MNADGDAEPVRVGSSSSGSPAAQKNLRIRSDGEDRCDQDGSCSVPTSVSSLVGAVGTVALIIEPS